jgi:hypothetical protein
MSSVKGLLFAAGTFVLLMAFQNCSPAKFSTSSISPDSTQLVAQPETSQPAPAVSASAGACNGQSNAGNPGDPSNAANSELVECELGAPNVKIVLKGQLVGDASNSVATRVCMSSQACLSLVNAYAAARNCSLAVGAPVAASPAGAICTQVFPGSNGTCNNAAVLSDSEIQAILAKMAGP